MSTTDVSYSIVTPSPQALTRIGSLFEGVYGSADDFRLRCRWEFLQYPASGIKVYFAEVNGQLVGVTVRHPAEITYGGDIRRAFFASNSMVLPEYRGKGIISALYVMAAAGGDLQLSKGTADGMYCILKQIGYQDIVPDTFQICLLNPLAWVLQRCGINAGGKCSSTPLSFSTGEFSEVFRIDDTMQEFCSRVWRNGIRKDATYLQWRYFDIPHKTYRVFLRKIGGMPASLVVLRTAGATAYLVDLLWDDKFPDEPNSSVVFAKKAALGLGSNKIIAWTTLIRLRSVLRKNLFFERGESPHFSWYCTCPDTEPLDWSKLHIVHGDGDIEYL